MAADSDRRPGNAISAGAATSVSPGSNPRLTFARPMVHFLGRPHESRPDQSSLSAASDCGRHLIRPTYLAPILSLVSAPPGWMSSRCVRPQRARRTSARVAPAAGAHSARWRPQEIGQLSGCRAGRGLVWAKNSAKWRHLERHSGALAARARLPLGCDMDVRGDINADDWRSGTQLRAEPCRAVTR